MNSIPRNLEIPDICALCLLVSCGQGTVPVQGAVPGQVAVPVQMVVPVQGAVPEQGAIPVQMVVPVQGAVPGQGAVPVLETSYRFHICTTANSSQKSPFHLLNSRIFFV